MSLGAELESSGAKSVPSNYINPISDRPNLSDVEQSDDSVPLIDIEGLHGPHRSQIITQIGQPCQDYGVFLVKNHGIPEIIISNILSTTMEFFKLPESERMKFYSKDPTMTIRLSTSFNNETKKVPLWREALKFRWYPVHDYVHEWPSNPPSFRKDVAEYCTSVRGLELALLEAISESLGLEKDYIDKAASMHEQGMTMNYYPPCPQPDLSVGVPSHTDPTVITVLLSDNVPGLQFLINGKWITVDPIPNTVVVNIGDIVQVLSNDRYMSVLQRAIANRDKE